MHFNRQTSAAVTGFVTAVPAGGFSSARARRERCRQTLGCRWQPPNSRGSTSGSSTLPAWRCPAGTADSGAVLQR